jgi:hypothetical protein
MRSLKFKMATAVTAVTLGGAGIGVAAQPAAAATAPTCQGAGCIGRDPSVYGCAGSTWTSWVVQDYNGNAVATLWKRWSNNCNATFWARGQLTLNAARAGDSIVIEIIDSDGNGHEYSSCYPGPSNTGAQIEPCSGATYTGTDVAWTDMVWEYYGTPTAEIWVYDNHGGLVNAIAI